MPYLGIEIGGTKLQLGLGRDDGVLLALWRGDVDAAKGADGIRAQIAAAVPELLDSANLGGGDLVRASIGFGGPTDDATRRVITSHQIAGWDDFPLGEWVSDIVGVPAVLGNDADVAALAESLHGAGKGCDPVFYMTLGTGIGGGLVINGNIHRGTGRGAAEVGHLRVATIGGVGMIPLEAAASGPGLAATAKYLLDESPTAWSVLRFAPLTGKAVVDAARLGDEVAADVMTYAVSQLAEAICHVVALLCPRRVVIGGGVSLAGEELLFDPLRRAVAERVFKPFAGLTGIVPAALGEEVVVHGAIALAARHESRRGA